MESDVVVLFDGTCNLCSGGVRFLIRHDPHARLRYGALQSARGQHLRNAYGVDDDVDSIIVLADGRALTHSTAAIRIGKELGGWARPLALAAGVVPVPIRDALYRFVARNRFRWFGRTEACWIPTPELNRRFLAD
jgi:predicted DCC family thiol-disulfide oxidoreductase YuxK